MTKTTDPNHNICFASPDTKMPRSPLVFGGCAPWSVQFRPDRDIYAGNSKKSNAKYAMGQGAATLDLLLI